MGHSAFYTDKGMSYNEDYVYTNGDFGFLLDGATGLLDNPISEGNSDAQCFSHQLGAYLTLHLREKEHSIQDILRAGVKQVKTSAFPNSKGIEPHLLPTCTFACFRKMDAQVEIAWLGDSPIVVEREEKTEIFYDEVLEAMDQHALNCLQDLLDEGKTFAEAKAGVKGILTENRRQMNTPEGYSILDLAGVGITKLQQRLLPAEEIRHLLICSDGFYRLHELFKMADFTKGLAPFTHYEYLVDIADQLRKKESQPNSLEQHLRFKVHDDASVLAVSF